MNYYLQTLTSARLGDGFSLSLVFSDGFAATLDLAPWIARGGIRARLADPALFTQVQINEFGVCEWPGEIDLSPGSLRAWCEAGRVLSKEETDAWIAAHSSASQAVA